ncbi:MAG: hypothetical protein ACE362_08365 [Phaeodactylibacter xiamenensis]|uniref:Uncharacterized protein n=1 Tax=Phaeodactylibacter xiamenensis TaxID=1524460 RepID=A0A098S7P1_9BACT|nr:hypothetical protein [Phaeodactylibacter xiamenensis]KGE88589.1 hypothetical protein IX84_07885 [Phaeodactylibacter xiamenensis]
MQSYLQSILPRLQRYSKQLNDEANFVEIPWAYMDDDEAKVTYLFRRNNELLVTKQGEVATGRWEYLPSMQSLLIDYEGKRRMYNQGFLDKTVLLLRKEGTEQLLPLANVNLLPDLNIGRYLEQRISEKEEGSTYSDSKYSDANKARRSYRELITKTGSKLIIWENNQFPGDYTIPGLKVTAEDHQTPIPDGEYPTTNGDIIVVLSGKIKEVTSDEPVPIDMVIFFSLAFLLLFLYFLWTYIEG